MRGVKDYSKSEYSQIAINGPVEKRKTKRTVLICVCLLILLAGVLLVSIFDQIWIWMLIVVMVAEF